MLNYIKQICGESAIYGFSMILSRIMAVILIPLYANSFSPDEYGKYSILISLFTILQMFASLSLDNSAATLYYNDTIPSDKKNSIFGSWFWTQLSVSIVFGLILLVASYFLSVTFFESKKEAQYFWILALNLPLTVVPALINNFLRLKRKPAAAAFISIVSTFSLLLANYVFIVKLKIGISGILFASTISFGLATCIGLFMVKEALQLASFDTAILKRMLKFSLPLIPASIAFWLLNSSGIFFLEHYSDKKQVGIYQMGLNFAQGVFLITGSFQMAWGPFAMSIHKQDNAKQVYINIMKAFIVVACLGLLILSVFSREIIYFFANEAYLRSYKIITVLGLNFILISLGYFANLGLGIFEQSKPYGFIILLSSLLTCVLYLLLTPRFGMMGVAISTVIGQSLVPIYLFYKADKVFPVSYPFAKIFTIIALTVLLSIWSWSIPSVLNGGSYLYKMSILVLYLSMVTGLFYSNILSMAQIIFKR